jgi:hypothetical protein
MTRSNDRRLATARRYWAFTLAGAWLVTGAVVVIHAAGGIAPPPKFEKETVELFRDDPLKMLGPGAPGTAVATSARPAAGGPAAATGGGGDSGPAAVQGWAAIISSDNLEAEIKSLITPLADATKSKQAFTSTGREKAQIAFCELTCLFHVAAQYDGEVRWKKEAIGLRNKFSQATMNLKTSSDAAFNEAKARTEDLNSLVRGGNVDLPKGEGPDEFGKMIHRPALMKRMELARAERLGPWTSASSAFSKNKDALARESQFMAMVGKLLQDPTLESGDDGDYQKFAKDYQAACIALVDAVKSSNQSSAQSAASHISKSCDSCHGQFR